MRALIILRVMQINELLSIDSVAVGLSAGEKESVISLMVDLLANNPSVTDLEGVREAVLERERIMSTGVGKEIALPHAKTSAVTSTVAVLATTSRPVEFGSLDNRPVRILFLLVGNAESKSEHIRILSRISRLMNRDEFRSDLLASSSREELLQLLKQEELHLASLN